MRQYILFKDGSNQPVAQFRATSNEEACDHVDCMQLDRNVQYDLFHQLGTDSSRWPWVTTVFVASSQPEP